MYKLRLIGGLDHNFGWRDGRLTDDTLSDPATPAPRALAGAVAGIGSGPGGRYRLLRDPLGLHKLFWSTADQTILVGARPYRLVQAGCPFESIRAIPPGTVVDLDLVRQRARVSPLVLGDPAAARAPGANAVTQLAVEIRARLERFFEALASAFRSVPLFVNLSGGLDSTGIAVLAREYFPGTVAVSFDVGRANGHTSEDRRTAARLARDLNLPLLCATPTEEDVLGALDTVLIEGIDWRDFNVHAGLVNASLARAIAAHMGADSRTPRLVLTGDLMNEFLVDYHAETHGDRVYYRLPRLRPAALRGVLVRGLETSHREIGPFQTWGLAVVQPYAVVADLLGALPPQFLADPDRKNQLSRLVFGTRIPAYVYARGKTRAQVGDSDSGAGVLALCANRGLDDRCLRRRYADLHGVRDPSALDRFIRGGRYRSGIPLADQELS